MVFPSPFLFLIFFVILINIPVSSSQDEFMYSTCKQHFDCGDRKNINYPFWGGNHPHYCGRPGFELVCLENGTAEINIASQWYRLLDINQNDHMLTIARKDLWTSDCSMQYPNTSLNFSIFSYPPTDINITYFYNCPRSIPGILPCLVGTDESGYQIVLTNSRDDVATYEACDSSVVIPVLKEFVNRYGIQERSSRTGEAVQVVLRNGFEVKYLADAQFCDPCERSGGRCGFSWTLFQPTCLCPGGRNQAECSDPGNKPKKVIIAAIVAGTLLTVATIVIVICCLRRKSDTSIVMWERKTKKCKKVEAFLKDCGLFELKRCKYKDVKKMTNSFKHKIGQGGYGSVFKGQLHEGKTVAVKVLSETKGDGNEFINEVAAISRTSHVNIVTLLGFCIEGTKRALIYEFMPNGSLEKFIYNKITLEPHFQIGWETLYKIAIGIARGLEYLHRGCNKRILHFDIKPHNILLDEDFTPKIADFGLSKLYNVKESLVSMTGARGTPGYIAPELFSRNFGGVSHKADVYSYGMMILEMVGGRKNIDVRVTNISEIYFPHWIYKRLDLNEDLGLHGVTSVEDQEIAQKMILVGLWCIQMDPLDRPPMSKVLDMLGGSLDALQVPPKPFLSSSSMKEEDLCTNMSTM